MGPLGADPEALHELSSAMRTASARLDDIATGLDRRARVTGWRGPDAERFTRDWNAQHGPALRALGTSCNRLAVTLRAQAEQQARASAGGAVVPARTGDGARQGTVLTETTYRGGIEVKAAVFNGIIRGDVSIRELGRGRTRLTLTETALAGVAASAGARLEHSIGEDLGTVTPASGTRAEGKARVGVTHRRTWEVDEDQVDDLLTRIAADQLITQGGGPTRFEDPLRERSIGGDLTGAAARWFGGVADSGVEWLTGVDPGMDIVADRLVAIPAAERAEALIVLEAVGGAGATAGTAASKAAPGGYVQASGTWSAGVARWRGGRSIIIENQAAGSASASVGLLGKLGIGIPDGIHASSDVRVELAERHDGAIDHVLLQVTTRVDDEQTESRLKLDLTGELGRSAAAGFRELADRASDLDLDGTIGAITSLAALDLPLDELEVSTTTADVSGTTTRLGGSVGAGLSVGIAAHGQVERVERPA